MPRDALDVTGWKLLKVGGAWRYVSHDKQLATAGYRTREAARRGRYSYSARPDVLLVLAARYMDLFVTHTES